MTVDLASLPLAQLSQSITEGGNLWLIAVNLVIWAGLFAYLLRLDRKVKDLERDR